MKEHWSVVFCILTFYKSTLVVNLLVANTSNRDQNFCEQKSISGGWDEYQSDQYKQNFSPWSGKLEYLHENKKVKFVQQFVKPARTTPSTRE